MTDVSIRDLRNHGGDIVDRVAAGEQVTITRAGKPVAELNPAARTPLTREELIERWSLLPPFDPDRLRADIDAIINPQI